MGALVENIKDRTNVNLLFNHGLGDCITFVPTVRTLMALFPSKNFHVVTVADQHKVFERYGIASSAHNVNCQYPNDAHTVTRVINYELTPSGSGLTKNDFCCKTEIGIAPPDEMYHSAAPLDSRIVGLHFQGTCMPHLTNFHEKMCRSVWDAVRRCGFIPLEVHLLHAFSNPVNKRFSFVDFSTREMRCNVDNLFSIIQSCHKFIGVLSGPAHCASMMLGLNNVLWLEKDIKIRDHLRTEHESVKESTFDEAQIGAFLSRGGAPSHERSPSARGRIEPSQSFSPRHLSWSP